MLSQYLSLYMVSCWYSTFTICLYYYSYCNNRFTELLPPYPCSLSLTHTPYIALVSCTWSYFQVQLSNKQWGNLHVKLAWIAISIENWEFLNWCGETSTFSLIQDGIGIINNRVVSVVTRNKSSLTEMLPIFIIPVCDQSTRKFC